jgi:hypothetical protein
LVASTPVSGLLVRCFRSKPDGFYSFDASVVKQSLRQKYGVK